MNGAAVYFESGRMVLEWSSPGARVDEVIHVADGKHDRPTAYRCIEVEGSRATYEKEEES